jgi:hypothetical protein
MKLESEWWNINLNIYNNLKQKLQKIYGPDNLPIYESKSLIFFSNISMDLQYFNDALNLESNLKNLPSKNN